MFGFGRGRHKRKNSASGLLSAVSLNMDERESPVLEARQATVSPRLWLFLGVSYVVIGERRLSCKLAGEPGCGRARLATPAAAAAALPPPAALRQPLPPIPAGAPGLVNVVLAALWHFWLGVALGFGVAKMGTSLCGMTLAARRELRWAAPCVFAGAACLLPALASSLRLQSSGKGMPFWYACKAQRAHHALAPSTPTRAAPPPPARGCFGWLKNLGRRMLMWGASKMQQLFYVSAGRPGAPR